MKDYALIIVVVALLTGVPLLTSSNVVLNFMVVALLIALVGGLFIGVVESLSGLYLGESLGQVGIFVIFILVLLFRPRGVFGERA